MAKRVVRRAARGLSKVSVQDINRELARRQKVASQLEVKRARLLSRVAELDREIRECGGSVGPARGGDRRTGSPRGGRSSTLAGALSALLKGKTMFVTEMVDAVRAAGYKSDAANFRTMINATVIKHANLFRRVARGQYTAK